MRPPRPFLRRRSTRGAAPADLSRPARRRAAAFTALAALVALACGSSPPPAAPRARRPALPPDIVIRSALPLHALHGPQRSELTEPGLWEEMAGARAICFGERHDEPAHHYAQHRALVELATRSAARLGTLGVGFEMFQRPHQAALTGFVAGAMPEDQFLTETEFEKRWGFDFALYRPLLETAREFSLQAIALNVPRELTRKLARGGLDSLDSGERRRLPELDLNDVEHREYFEDAMGNHPMPDGAPSVDDMYVAQVVWDETMAESASEWFSRSGESAQLIVFAGAGHCHPSAIPRRFTRRTEVPMLSVLPVLASELTSDTRESRYEWLVVLDD